MSSDLEGPGAADGERHDCDHKAAMKVEVVLIVLKTQRWDVERTSEKISCVL